MYQLVKIDRQEIILGKEEKYHSTGIKLIYCNTSNALLTFMFWRIFNLRKIFSVYSFPKNPAVRLSWFNILNIGGSSITSRAYICSDHFKKEDYDTKTSACRLFPNALPIGIQVQIK